MLKLRRALRERRRSPRAAPGRARPVEGSPVPGPAPLRAPLPARAHAACGGRPLAAGGAAPPSASPPSSLHARSGCRVAAAPAPRWRRRSSRRWKVTAAPLPPGPAPGSRGSRPPPSPPIPADGRCERPRAAAAGAGPRRGHSRAPPSPPRRRAAVALRCPSVPGAARRSPSPRPFLPGPPFAPCVLGHPCQLAASGERSCPCAPGPLPSRVPAFWGLPVRLAVLLPLGHQRTIDGVTPSPGAPRHPCARWDAVSTLLPARWLLPHPQGSLSGPGPAAVHAPLLPSACSPTAAGPCVCVCWCAGPRAVCRALWRGPHLALQGSVLGSACCRKAVLQGVFSPNRITCFPLTRGDTAAGEALCQHHNAAVQTAPAPTAAEG